MNVRKFVAGTSREALYMVRGELGADAVILSNRKVDGGVEIVALPHDALSGTETVRATGKANPAARQATQAPRAQQAEAREQQGILSEIKSMRDMLQDQLSCLAWSDMQQRDPKRTQILRSLLNAGFSPGLSRQLLDKMPAGANMEWMRRVLENNVRVAAATDDVVVRGGVCALVGPTGVGKTTTTAKLAALAVVRYGPDKVALITTDSYRIGAYEQLRIYGKILGVSVHAVRDTEDLRLTLSALKHKHLVLVDTIGMGQRDSRVADQSEMLDACGVQRLLLLNATSSSDTLDDVVSIYGGKRVIGCIATKLDEAVTLGNVLDAVIRRRLTLHYIANGQRVPEDLHEVNREYLLHRAFRSSSRPNALVIDELEFPALMGGVGKPAEARGEYAA